MNNMEMIRRNMASSILIIPRLCAQRSVVGSIRPPRFRALSWQSRKDGVLYSPRISNTAATSHHHHHHHHDDDACLMTLSPLQGTVAMAKRNWATSTGIVPYSSFQYQHINRKQTSSRSFASSEFQAANDRSKNRPPTNKSKKDNGKSKHPSSSSGQPPPQSGQKDIWLVSDILDDYMKWHRKLEPYQVAKRWNDLGKAVQKSHNKWEQQNFWINHKASLQTLVEQTIQVAKVFDGRSTATVTHSLVKLLQVTNSSFQDKFKSLWDTLLNRTILHIQSDGFNAHSISNLIWAFAKVDKIKVEGQLLNDIASKAQLCMNDFAPQGLSNVAWGYATLNHKVPLLFDAIASAAQECIHGFKPQELSNIIMAYAKMNHNAPEFFDAIAKASQKHLVDFKPQELANTAWSFATLGHKAPLLFDVIASTAPLCIHDFKPQELSNIIMAYAKMNHKSPELFDAIVKASQKHLVDFNPQTLSNTAWSFATLGHQAPSLFDDIAQATQIQIDEFKPQELSNLAWAFATLNHSAPSLFDSIANAAQAHIDNFNPQDLANTAWAFATLDHIAPALFEAIARATPLCIHDFKPQELLNLAWSFAVFNMEPNSFTHTNSTFAQTLLSTDASKFTVKGLRQLHQFHLWCKEQDRAHWFPDELSQQCHEAFVSAKVEPSRLQNDVVKSLWLLQNMSQVDVEVWTESGYSLDVVITYRGDCIGMEVDGPFHFVGQSQSPNGKTILKRRQLRALEGLKLVSVPYWEWREIDMGSKKERKEKKQRYLQNLLKQVA